MVTFLIIWYIIGVILIWISEWKRGNVKRLSQKPFIDTVYAIGVSLLRTFNTQHFTLFT